MLEDSSLNYILDEYKADLTKEKYKGQIPQLQCGLKD